MAVFGAKGKSTIKSNQKAAHREGAEMLPETIQHIKMPTEGQKTIRARADEIRIALGHETIFEHINPDDYMWTGHGSRSVEKLVTFDQPFERPPQVIL
ncbi:hypothetical protein AIOL_003469 [Candidatus Rhodobacter oscarellae]|uniref:Uncharacterized protein n=1 Tax=Candidatus Rhodobacter oscarellae TaxID=1675527 RepID=A0A0J9E9Z5_9RHOB|nr:hypothetical protein [Candidatus Rhodobacter lobularis]KMW58494.1 hypothetical protein AIOL_003469 [Candidatus Rhodobacter lobularis]